MEFFTTRCYPSPNHNWGWMWSVVQLCIDVVLMQTAVLRLLLRLTVFFLIFCFMCVFFRYIQWTFIFVDYLIHWVQKRSDRSRFFKANFDGFWQFSQKVLKIQKLYIPHWKALIYSYYEPEGQGVWCLHMTARLLGMKLELFSLKGVWQICLEGHALYH